MLKNLGVKSHYMCDLLSNGSGKNILPRVKVIKEREEGQGMCE